MYYSMYPFKKLFEKKGYEFFDKGTYNLNIIGERTENSQSNQFDDILHVIYQFPNGKWNHVKYAITTDPGKYWLHNPLNSEGTAILVPGQNKGAFKIGIHGRSWKSGGYEALEQVKPMEYVRDNNKDSKLNFELYRDPELRAKHSFKANIKSNIHRASLNSIARLVDRYSAACQVFQNAKDFDRFMLLCKMSAAKYGNSFTYTLIESRDL